MKIVTDWIFLENLILNLKSNRNIDDFGNKIIVAASSILDLLLSSTAIYVYGLNRLSATPNPVLNRLLLEGKLLPLSDQKLKMIEQGSINNLGSEFVFFLFSVGEQDSFTKWQSQQGFYMVNNYEKINELMGDVLIEYNSKKTKDWTIVKEVFNPHHAILIADPYVFTEVGFKALTQFLKFVSPKELKRQYHVTIIGSSTARNYYYSSNKPDENTLLDHDEILKRGRDLKKELSVSGLNANVEAFVYNGRDFHDRYIFTNNLAVFAGSGIHVFSIENNRPKKEGSWIIQKPFKRICFNNTYDTFFYEFMIERLNGLKDWIIELQTSQNPLLRLPERVREKTFEFV